MKEDELRERAKCGICGNKILSKGLPLFYKVTIERFMVDLPALKRQQGLGLMVGAPLAQVMGPNEELAQPVMDPQTITICEDCSTNATLPIAALVR